MPAESLDIRKVDVNFASTAITVPMEWYDASSFTLEGQGWATQGELAYCRLPAKAQAIVSPSIWYLSRHSSGIAVRFVADAAIIAAQWELRYSPWTASHMPATASSSFDLYVRDGKRGRFAGVIRPPLGPEDPAKPNQIIGVLAKDLNPGRREYMAYFPLYNGVSSVRIGVPTRSFIAPAPPRAPAGVKPICFYGTSVVQGGCASRPGMSHAAILGRRFDRPIINLGFSGNGKILVEIARLLGELDPSVFVIDPLNNNTTAEVEQHTEVFIRTLRQARPQTPIVMVAGLRFQQDHHVKLLHDRYLADNAAWRAAYDRLLAEGVKNLHYAPGEHLFGDDGDATVDGIHATDLGFTRIADVLEPVLRPLI